MHHEQLARGFVFADDYRAAAAAPFLILEILERDSNLVYEVVAAAMFSKKNRSQNATPAAHFT